MGSPAMEETESLMANIDVNAATDMSSDNDTLASEVRPTWHATLAGQSYLYQSTAK
jgi:hypothetical protein